MRACKLISLFALSTALKSTVKTAMFTTTAVSTVFHLPSNEVQQLDSATLLFTKETSKPLSLHTTTPLQSNMLLQNEFYRFSVALPVKERRTAIGFSFGNPEANYLTPTYVQHHNYISMGGAGFIYPMTVNCGTGYGEGDQVSCSIFPTERRVMFHVNDIKVYDAVLPPTYNNLDVIYPTISSEGGVVEAKVCIDKFTNE
jgi:hypothetical protein